MVCKILSHWKEQDNTRFIKGTTLCSQRKDKSMLLHRIPCAISSGNVNGNITAILCAFWTPEAVLVVGQSAGLLQVEHRFAAEQCRQRTSALPCIMQHLVTEKLAQGSWITTPSGSGQLRAPRAGSAS